MSSKYKVHHVPQCMSCHKAIVVITGRAHCFHDENIIEQMKSDGKKDEDWIIFYTKAFIFTKICMILRLKALQPDGFNAEVNFPNV